MQRCENKTSNEEKCEQTIFHMLGAHINLHIPFPQFYQKQKNMAENEQKLFKDLVHSFGKLCMKITVKHLHTSTSVYRKVSTKKSI